MVPPDSGRIPPVPPYSGYSPLNTPFSHTGLSPSAVVLSRTLPLRCVHDLGVLQPRERLDVPGLGSSAFARHYSRNHYCFLFLCLLRCFSSAGSPPYSRMSGLQPDGLPHSEIRVSELICSYARLIAACHVLPRLQEPWHPPCALGYFIVYRQRHHVFMLALSCILFLSCSIQNLMNPGSLVSSSNMSMNSLASSGGSRGE